METTKLSAEGKVLIPQSLREAHRWKSGQELIAINMGDGILLKPKKPFPETSLHDVAGCLKYQGTPKTLEDMENAMAQGIEELWHENGLDFADAFHLAHSQNYPEFYTFDEKFVKRAVGLTQCVVKNL